MCRIVALFDQMQTHMPAWVWSARTALFAVLSAPWIHWRETSDNYGDVDGDWRRCRTGIHRLAAAPHWPLSPCVRATSDGLQQMWVMCSWMDEVLSRRVNGFHLDVMSSETGGMVAQLELRGIIGSGVVVFRWGYFCESSKLIRSLGWLFLHSLLKWMGFRVICEGFINDCWCWRELWLALIYIFHILNKSIEKTKINIALVHV